VLLGKSAYILVIWHTYFLLGQRFWLSKIIQLCFGMIEIRKIEMSDYEKSAEMIKTTIMTSFDNLYSELLKEAICKKYDLENFILSAKEIEMWIATEDNKIVWIHNPAQADAYAEAFLVEIGGIN